MGRILSPAEVAVAQQTALQPFNEPITIVAVPTLEEMAVWQPNRDPENIRWRTEFNVTTGERTYYELTLDEYKARHIAKIKSRNEYVVRKADEARQAKRKALLEKLLDEMEAKVV